MTNEPAMTIEEMVTDLTMWISDCSKCTYAVTRSKCSEALTEAYARGRRDMGEEAAEIAQNACLVPPDGGSPSQEASDACDYAATAIRALIEKEPTT